MLCDARDHASPFIARHSDGVKRYKGRAPWSTSSWRFARSARVAQLDLAGYTPRGLHMSSDSSDHGNSQKKKKRSRHKCTATALPPAEPSPTPQPAPWRSTQFQLVDGVNRYRAGQQEVDGTIMLYGYVSGHMCSFAQLTDYSRKTFRIDREILFIFKTGVHTSRPAALTPSQLSRPTCAAGTFDLG